MIAVYGQPLTSRWKNGAIEICQFHVGQIEELLGIVQGHPGPNLLFQRGLMLLLLLYILLLPRIRGSNIICFLRGGVSHCYLFCN